MRRRPAYTLLEVILALAIAVLLLAALYTAVGYQLRHAQAGRDLIGQATLARAVFSRLTSDVSATAGLCDPTRFRNPPNLSNSANAGSSSTSSGGSTTGAAASGTTSSGSGAAASSTTSSSTSSTTSSSTSSTTTQTTTVTLPLGVIGDSTSLNLFVSLVPSEVWGTNPGDQGVLTSDLRRIVYWLDSTGLCRQEMKVVTSQDAMNTTTPTGDPASCLLAPEVKSVEFSYFDGTNWTDSWDSTMIVVADGVTPQGSPRAIAITVGMASPGSKGSSDSQGELKQYRHVIAITSANGATPLQQPNPSNPALTANQSSTSGTTGASGSTSSTGN